MVLKAEKFHISPDIASPLPEVFSWLLLPLSWK